MKVCTDACMLGAYIANSTSIHIPQLARTNCLDVGTGTGLLSLMYAQENPNAIIDAVEIERHAYEQAKENFSKSIWNGRLKISHSDARDFVSHKKYDLIICNPPFYENELLSREKNKNLAKHDVGLLLTDLIIIIKNHLSVSGYFVILLPYYRIGYFLELAEGNNLFLQEKLLIRQTPSHNIFRAILLFSYCKKDVKTNEIVIKDSTGSYTDEFVALLKDYYLQF
jgi:tRNA1Val (adenine37-N6)-methyltransferase